MNMQDFFNAKELAAYYTAVKDARGNLFGASLFPIVRSTDMSLTWVKGYRARNVVLAPAALDTHAVIRSQQPAEKITTEMPFFKEAMRFNEGEQWRGRPSSSDAIERERRARILTTIP
jgi:hypothetical protein